ncbi:16S rRNA (cytidine(1402)-2'-O)-methyltransferase [Motiliproteus sediminis]|uniref:16S rRNA (cytidine(1402)-2'-O)-methyltransferase n=1 Tax=Motiliproteus sediminis TaxID=1468178 RepID=UPI001AEF98CB|nr:16S rRNA (cytidine(1402)-2'-O)-methyltransferase [Motiliproteus sediminis]
MSEAALYIVATPIGNLGDITARALDVLRSVQLIAAEDTRHSARLLQHFGIETPMWAVHDHNERGQADRILQRLKGGENIALISDAGTPLISDPGFYLVRTVREAGLRVVPVPGCCALVTALCAAGIATDRFRFEGFLPAKVQARLQRLESLVADTATLVFYESPHRILDSLAALRDVFGGERYVVLARELTKTFETIHGDSLDQLIPWVEHDANQQRGEFVLVVQGAEAPAADDLDGDALRVLEVLLEELSVKQAAALAAKLTGVKKKLLYQEALRLKGE